MITEETHQVGDLQIQIALVEYQKLRDELLQHVHYHQQLPVIALGAFATLVPLLLTQVSNWPSYAVVGVLHGIAIAFSVIVMQYSSALFSMHQIAAYCRDHIEPLVNRWANSEGITNGLFSWETQVKFRRGNVVYAAMESAGASGTGVLMLLPGLATLILAYILPSAQPTGALGAQLDAALFILAIIAWCSYFYSLATLLGVTLYSMTRTAGYKKGDLSRFTRGVR